LTQFLNILHDIAKYSSILIVGERFVLDGLRSFSVSYIYTNLLGNEAGRAIYDGDAMIARF
jgi:hypothetical protein